MAAAAAAVGADAVVDDDDDDVDEVDECWLLLCTPILSTCTTLLAKYCFFFKRSNNCGDGRRLNC